jgi:hypothetical protein
MSAGLTDSEITRVVNRYIGVSGGYLGLPERFSYRTHEDFYADYCDVSIDLSAFDRNDSGDVHSCRCVVVS